MTKGIDKTIELAVFSQNQRAFSPLLPDLSEASQSYEHDESLIARWRSRIQAYLEKETSNISEVDHLTLDELERQEVGGERPAAFSEKLPKTLLTNHILGLLKGKTSERSFHLNKQWLGRYRDSNPNQFSEVSSTLVNQVSRTLTSTLTRQVTPSVTSDAFLIEDIATP